MKYFATSPSCVVKINGPPLFITNNVLGCHGERGKKNCDKGQGNKLIRSHWRLVNIIVKLQCLISNVSSNVGLVKGNIYIGLWKYIENPDVLPPATVGTRNNFGLYVLGTKRLEIV